MTEECHLFIETVLKKYPQIQGYVLELGSCAVSGGSPRHRHFKMDRFHRYIGLDMIMGPGVDIYANTHQIPIVTEKPDVVLCCEMLEHDDAFWLTFQEITRVLAPNGFLILTVPSWRAIAPHAYPNDYWRFLSSGIQSQLETNNLEVLELIDNEGDGHIFALARKPV